MKSLFVFSVLILLLSGCHKKQPDPLKDRNSEHWLHVTVKRDTLLVHIPIEGKLTAWKKVDILSPVKARLVSLLVGEKDRVRRGDLIASLWPVQPYNNYATIDIKAPLTGIVSTVYFEINDTIPRNHTILTVENRDNLILTTILNKGAMAYLKPDLNVALFYEKQTVKGALWKINRRTQKITVVVPNQQLGLEQDLYVKGFIDLGPVGGTFLNVRYFGFSDSIKAQLKQDSVLTIQKVGLAADSLVLIYPALPDSNRIRIKKILTF